MTIRPVSLTWTSDRSLADVRTWVASQVCAGVLVKAGYRVEKFTPDELIMTKRESSGWLILISLVAFALTPSRNHQVVFRFQTLSDGRSQLLTIGDLPTKVADILRELDTEQNRVVTADVVPTDVRPAPDRSV